MTIAAFYDRSAFDGRAVIDGDAYQPQCWIVRAISVTGDVAYWACESASVEIREVDPQMDIARLARFRNLGGRPRKPILTHGRY